MTDADSANSAVPMTIIYVVLGVIGVVGFGVLIWLNRHIYGAPVALESAARPEPASRQNNGSDGGGDDQKGRDVSQDEAKAHGAMLKQGSGRPLM